MRVISQKTLKALREKHADSEQPIKAWLYEAEHADWKTLSAVKARHRSTDLLPGNRVAFNLKGNTYRLMFRIHFNTGIAFIRFTGTHAAYDKLVATPPASSPTQAGRGTVALASASKYTTR